MVESGRKEIVFRGVKGVALPMIDEARAKHFYEDVLELPVDSDADEPFRYLLGDTILMLKKDWYAPPSAEPSPRITLQVDDARATEKALRQRDVVIADPVETYGGSNIGSFLDSEGNKFWFCSYV